jgi:integrase
MTLRRRGGTSTQNWFNPIETHAFPVIGHLRVDGVESRHILAVLRAMDAKGVSNLGRKVRSRLKTVFDALIAHGQRDAALGNPADAGVINAGRMKKGKSETEHYRRIALDAAPDVFARLVGLAADNVAIACWAFMGLTAARPGEALAARWDEIDLEKKLWMNPATKTRAKTEPLPVPLSPLALAVLDLQAKAPGGRPHLPQPRRLEARPFDVCYRACAGRNRRWKPALLAFNLPRLGGRHRRLPALNRRGGAWSFARRG